MAQENNALKYELTDTHINHYGRALHRIKALRDIEPLGVRAGDLGGWIEKAENLSQSGDARVSGDARLSEPYDMLTVSSIGSRNDTTTFFRRKDGGVSVTCGCFEGTIDEFEARVKAVHGESKHGMAYAAAIAMARAVVNAEGAEGADISQGANSGEGASCR